jgi:hypothetical protein
MGLEVGRVFYIDVKVNEFSAVCGNEMAGRRAQISEPPGFDIVKSVGCTSRSYPAEKTS